ELAQRKVYLGIEGSALFIGIPIAYAVGGLRVPVILLLILITAACWTALRRVHGKSVRQLLHTKATGEEWRRMMITCAVAIPLLICALWWAKPEYMFFLISHHPKIWLLVMVAYPIVSVLPQELIYRVFFFERYRPLFGKSNWMIAASALAFGFGHV